MHLHKNSDSAGSAVREGKQAREAPQAPQKHTDAPGGIPEAT